MLQTYHGYQQLKCPLPAALEQGTRDEAVGINTGHYWSGHKSLMPFHFLPSRRGNYGVPLNRRGSATPDDDIPTL
jgi:hypothetical protein